MAAATSLLQEMSFTLWIVLCLTTSVHAAAWTCSVPRRATIESPWLVSTRVTPRLLRQTQGRYPQEHCMSANGREEIESNDDNDITDKEEAPSTRRVGGRNFRSTNRKDKNGIPGWFILAIPFLAFWLFMQSAFTPSNQGYVYYQSSLFESRVIGPNGKVETARMENVRTNIPILLEGRKTGNF